MSFKLSVELRRGKWKLAASIGLWSRWTLTGSISF